MKIPERKVIVGLVSAFILWYIVFMVDIFTSFWFRVTLASILLSVYVYKENGLPNAPSVRNVLIGLAYGIGLYGLFFVGFNVFRPLVEGGAVNVYVFRDELNIAVPALLLLVTSFCEEYFWRRYTQTKMVNLYGKTGILITSILYAAIHIATQNLPLTAAALIAGLAWGIIYEYTGSFWIIVFSHIAWTELIFVLLPLK